MEDTGWLAGWTVFAESASGFYGRLLCSNWRGVCDQNKGLVDGWEPVHSPGHHCIFIHLFSA